MAKFKLEFDMDNAAFEDAPKQEVARIMQKVLRQFDERWPIEDGHPVSDVNGNKVGKWEVMV